MSPSPGHGRDSVSPRRSETSSNTIRSSYSGHDAESAEGSSRGAKRRSHLPTSLDDPSVEEPNERHPSKQYVGDELGTEHDHGSRRRRPRNSGGFLLQSAFGTDEGRHHNTTTHSTPPQDSKGKGKAKHNGTANGSLKRPKRTTERPISRDRSPFDGAVRTPNASHGHNGGEYRASAESTGSSTGRNGHLQVDSPTFGESSWHQPTASSPVVDPTQIVQMALSLSEGRRRHVSGSFLAPPPAGGGRRTTSAGLPAGAPMLQGSYAAGGSLKRYLNEQRRISRNISPGLGRHTPPPRHVSMAYGRLTSLDASALAGPTRMPMSDATLARAEKARAYIESRSQYMRLLDNLPPLKPDSTALGNSLYKTISGAGGTVDFRRMPSYAGKKHPLGRQFNPLQVIRNRKLRARIRRPFNPDIDCWDDLDSISDWVDHVEESAQHPGFRDQDRVHLPKFLDDDGELHAEEQAPSAGHRRIESTNAKSKRPRSDWTVTPCELLADAYWLEQEDNKGLIEDRHNNLIFPAQGSTETPISPSKESRRSAELPQKWGTMSSESMASPQSTHVIDHAVDAESPAGSYRGRKDHHRDESPGRLRQLWHKRRQRSPSSSGLDDTDDEIAARKAKFRRRVVSGEDNIGPLERHMNNMIEKEGQGNEASPDLVSPRTPEKWGKGHPSVLSSPGFSVTDTDGDPTIPAAITSHPKPAQRKMYPPLDTSYEPRSSMEDVDSSVPNSPVAASRLIPGLALSGSPSHSRASSTNRLPKKSRLHFFHSNASKDSRKPLPKDFHVDDSDNKSSRQTSGETEGQGRSSLEVPSVKHLFSHKTSDSLGSLNERPRSRDQPKDDKEPASAVTRFFKGGRIGDLVRSERGRPNEIVFKQHPPLEEQPGSSRSSTIASEPESAGEEPLPLAREKSKTTSALSKTASNQSWASRALDRARSDRPRYNYDNLPTFRSTHHSQLSLNSTSDKSKASRFNLLHPLRTDMSDLSRQTTRNSNLTAPDTHDSSDRRNSYGFPHAYTNDSSGLSRQSSNRLAAILDVPGSVGRGGLPATALRNAGIISSLQPRHSSLSPARRPTLDGTRHWSISDNNINISRQRSLSKTRSASAARKPISATVVSKVDIERVRALLVCTGIKAESISRRAQEVRSPEKVHAFLRTTADITGQQLIPVPRKEEHVLAARMLAEDFEHSVDAVKSASETFQTARASEMARRLDELRRKASEEMMERSRKLADEAEMIAVGVTTKGTREVQAVNEAVQALVRARRRRMRWVRRVGWGTVEWLLLGVMWLVWLVVMVVRMVLRVVGGVVCAVKWLFFL